MNLHLKRTYIFSANQIIDSQSWKVNLRVGKASDSKTKRERCTTNGEHNFQTAYLVHYFAYLIHFGIHLFQIQIYCHRQLYTLHRASKLFSLLFGKYSSHQECLKKNRNP